MSLKETSNCIWETLDDIYCTKCSKKTERANEIQDIGIFCQKCFMSELGRAFFSMETALIRGIVDIDYPNKKTSKTIERSRITNAIRYKVLNRDGFKCKACGSKAGDTQLVVDHIIPISKGGKSNFDNLQALCFTCNSGKSDKL